MFFHRIESPGLAHYSYLIGDNHEAVVIDPRRDGDVYLDLLSKEGTALKYILETHRNEDYVIGSVGLAGRTGAEIWHAEPHMTYGYGDPVDSGQIWHVGRLRIEALHTPGHTAGHMCYLLYDSGGAPWIIFTGDVLFAGDLGRVDLLGANRIPEMAGYLYDSIYKQILPLGDHVIACPSHGSGSVCGESIADRIWTTIGMERLYNPKLQYKDRSTFIRAIGQALEKPPYFSEMEKLNLEGAPLLAALPVPEPLSPNEFAERAVNGLIVDTRMDLSFGAAHVPGSISIWEDGLPSFAGWFIPYGVPIFLVTETEDPSQAVQYLIRLGFDRIEGRLAGGMLAWHMAGLASSSHGTIPVQNFCGFMDQGNPAFILDVRSESELEKVGLIKDARHIHITQLPNRLDEIPKDVPVYILCGSGLRSTIAASLLMRTGRTNVHVILGGMAGWKSDRCPIIK